MRVDLLHVELVVLPVATLTTSSDRNHRPLQQLPWYVARPSIHSMTTATLGFSIDDYVARSIQKENDSNDNHKRARKADEEEDNLKDNESNGHNIVSLQSNNNLRGRNDRVVPQRLLRPISKRER